MNLLNESLFKSLFDNPAMGIALLHTDGSIVKINDMLCRQLGYAAPELEHTLLQQIIMPEYESNFRNLTSSLLAGEKPEKTQIAFRSKSGTAVHAQVTLRPSTAADTDPLLIVFAHEFDKKADNDSSLSHAEETQQATLRAHNLQRLITKLATQLVNIPLDQLNNAVHHVLAEIGTFAEVDRAYVFKYDFEAETFSNTHEWCAPGISPEIETMQDLPLGIIADVARAHQAAEGFHIPRVEDLPHDSDLYRLLAPQQIKTLITVPMLSDGICFGFIGFDSVKSSREWKEEEISLLTILAELLTNAKNRQQHDLSLREIVERFKGLFDLSPVGIVLNDFESGQFIEGNPAFLKSSGYTLPQLKHVMLSDLECSKSLFPGNFNANGTFGPYENEILRLDGSCMHVLQSGMQFYDKNGRRLLWSILQDFTQIKAYQSQLETALDLNRLANEELRLAMENAEQANRAKESFLANMSHEIRTPMNGILGISNMLGKTELNPTQQNYLNIIRHSAKNLLVVINDVLDLAKIESGKMELEQIPFNIQESLKTTFRTLSYKAEEKGISFTIKPLPIADPVLVGDPYRLNQILLNLASNAIKFTEKGEVTLSSSVTEETTEQVTILFSVTDTGIGIPESKLDLIFEGFTQAYSNTTRKHGGTGLGLSICKQLVEMQRGTIWVKSVSGAGSCFSFCLTYPKFSDSALPEQIEEVTDFSTLGNKRVLLAEDNEINAFLAKSLMEGWGFQVDVAANGTQAVELAKHSNYDVILMDIQMPELSGIDATGLIRAFPDKTKAFTPIIALTANAIKGDAEKYLQAGMDDYISKPFDEAVLYQKIARFLPKTILS